MEKIKVNKKIISICILILLIILIVISVKKVEIKNSISKLQEEEIEKGITYEVYSNESNILKLLIKAIDKENGISEIELPDNDKIICNGQEKVGFDYEIKEDGEYTIISKSTTGEINTKTIVVNDEFRKNIIKIEKIQEISTEQDYRVTRDIEGYKWYYSIGKNDNWIEIPNYNIVNVDAYKVIENQQQDENGKVTLKVKRVGESGNTVQISKLLEDFNIENIVYNKEEQVIEGESIIACVRDNELQSGNYRLKVNGEEYPAEVYNYNEDVNYISDKNLGTSEKDNKMLIMKYTKNLNINNGRIMTANTRKKGMFIYVEGELINNGEISMTGRGANVQGQNVYLLKNSDNTYEYVPAIGGNGSSGATISLSKKSVTINGNPGQDGINRRTGGGGSGRATYVISNGSPVTVSSGGGTQGTSYSGGTGGGSGSVYVFGYSWSGGAYFSGMSGTSGQSNGGAGGNGSSGGTGNPGGNSGGTSGTGGLLIVFSNKLNNNNKISSNGISSNGDGGASGGGSVNIFYNELVNKGTIEAIKGNSSGGGNGGNGSVTEKQMK